MARYRPNDPRDYLAALDFIERAKERQFDIELKKYYPPRSNRQRKYLHFLLSYFAHVYGCTLTEAKECYFKQIACRELFEVEKTDKDGNHIHYFRSTEDLNTAEYASAIKNFLVWSDMHGVMLPEPTDDLAIRCAEREMESSNGWR